MPVGPLQHHLAEDFDNKPIIQLADATFSRLKMAIPSGDFEVGYALVSGHRLRMELFLDPATIFDNVITTQKNGQYYTSVNQDKDKDEADFVYELAPRRLEGTSTEVFACHAITPLAMKVMAHRMDGNTLRCGAYSERARMIPTPSNLVKSGSARYYGPCNIRDVNHISEPTLEELPQPAPTFYNHSDFPLRPQSPTRRPTSPPLSDPEPDTPAIKVSGPPPYKHPWDKRNNVLFDRPDQIWKQYRTILIARPKVIRHEMSQDAVRILDRAGACYIDLTDDRFEFKVPYKLALKNLCEWFAPLAERLRTLEPPMVRAFSRHLHRVNLVLMTHFLHGDTTDDKGRPFVPHILAKKLQEKNDRSKQRKNRKTTPIYDMEKL